MSVLIIIDGSLLVTTDNDADDSFTLVLRCKL